MKYTEEFRGKALILGIADKIKQPPERDMTLMEVCGGHTMAIHRYGLQSLLPSSIRLISGPGCPVCVSCLHFIDKAIAYSRIPGVIITTYGDLIRVPGSFTSLEKERALGSDIRIIYSVLDALEIARVAPERKVVFLGIGFETTAPATAAAILKASEENIRNFFVLSSHKVMPPAMKALVNDEIRIDGFIAPGHVSTITGTGFYEELASGSGVGVVVAGFEPADIMQSILMLAEQIKSGAPGVEIQYKRAVKPAGNKVARAIMDRVFHLKDDEWRGLGIIPRSGLRIREEFAAFDAEKQIQVEVPLPAEPDGCICGSILRGTLTPNDCRLFGKICNPVHPVGACMVSQEGTCSTYFKYRS
jgi:hydrogenase expression/formation protein HypD